MNQKTIPMLPTKIDQSERTVIPSVLGTVTSYIEILDRGATEREVVRARSLAVCTMLHEQREVMVGYLNHRFGERNKLYDGYFRLIDKAMESGNDDVTRLALESLLQVYSSPLVSDSDNFMAQYGKINSALSA